MIEKLTTAQEVEAYALCSQDLQPSIVAWLKQSVPSVFTSYFRDVYPTKYAEFVKTNQEMADVE